MSQKVIPKIIHFCWFGGGEKSKDVLEYIKTWQQLLPDYKIMEWNDGAECRVYEYKDDITGYSVRASFADGEFYLEQWNSLEEEKAIYSAHGITDNVVSFDRLMKLSNS